MSFSSISNFEKLEATKIALKNVEANIYRLVGELGLDPDSFDTESFSYDENDSDPTTNFDLGTKRHIANEISKASKLKQKIAQLS